MDDAVNKDIERLARAYDNFNKKTEPLLNEIHVVLPALTIHHITHIDALWSVASTIAGSTFVMNPLEGFILGGAFLLHDAGMALASFPTGMEEVKSTVQWKD